MSNEKNVLIIEDHPTNLKLFSVLLTIEGYKIHTARSAQEALQVMGAYKPNLILMDIQLPDLDGLELTRRLKKDTRYSDIPIVAITAYAMKGDREKALEAGCVEYISKPIDPKSFLETIAKYITVSA